MKPKTLLITGASRGIGRSITEKLIQEGHKVIAVARTITEETFSHPHVTPIALDLSQLDALPEAFNRIQENHPEIEGLICNAGRGLFGNLEELSNADIKNLMELNVLSQVYLIKAFLPAFKQKRRGHIVILGSHSGIQGKPKATIYCASKFALRGLAQSLREELREDGIGVTILNPGMIKTGFFDELAFRPGDAPEHYILPTDIAEIVSLVLQMRPETVIDEITLTPLNQVKLQKKSTLQG